MEDKLVIFIINKLLRFILFNYLCVKSFVELTYIPCMIIKNCNKKLIVKNCNVNDSDELLQKSVIILKANLHVARVYN